MKLWELENRENILRWEIHYGYEDIHKVWHWYKGFKISIFQLRDGSTKEFKTLI